MAIIPTGVENVLFSLIIGTESMSAVSYMEVGEYEICDTAVGIPTEVVFASEYGCMENIIKHLWR